MKNEETIARGEMKWEHLDSKDFIDAVEDDPRFMFLDGVYHVRPGLMEVEVRVFDPKQVRSFGYTMLPIPLWKEIEIRDMHFRCGSYSVTDGFSSRQKRYLVVSQFVPYVTPA